MTSVREELEVNFELSPFIKLLEMNSLLETEHRMGGKALSLRPNFVYTSVCLKQTFCFSGLGIEIKNLACIQTYYLHFFVFLFPF